MISSRLIFKVFQKVLHILPVELRVFFYWKLRAREFGKRSVLNISHDAEEYDQITASQQKIIFPLVARHLRGDENVCLDFGCGPGRFTGGLAKLINGKCIGVDPISELIRLAPEHQNVEYKLIEKGRIPLANKSVDVVWCCLVLGAIPDSRLFETSVELMRVLRNGGLFALIENTSNKQSSEYWNFRTQEFYSSIFFDVELQSIHTYEDCGETISIMLGRKNSLKQ